MTTPVSDIRRPSTASHGTGVHGAPYGALLPPTKEHKFDQGWSWIVDLGVFTMLFITVGWFRCYGVVFVTIVELHNDTNYRTSWVGTVNAAAFSLFSPVGSLLAERFSNRCVVITGGLFMATGLIAGHFVYSLNAYIITIGLVHGIGAALVYVPAIAMLGTYFRKHMGLATGIAFTGSSCSQMIMPPLVTALIDHYGLHGTLLILGGIALNICVAGAVLFPVGPAAIKAADDEILRQLALNDLMLKRKETPIVKKESQSLKPPDKATITEENEDNTNEDMFGQETLMLTNMEMVEKVEESTEGRYKKQRRASSSSIGAGRRASRSIHLPQRLRRFSVRRFSMTLNTVRRSHRLRSAMANLSSPILWMLMIGYSIGSFTFFAGMKYVPPHAELQHINKTQITMMLALCGIPDILIRLGIGLALDTHLIKTTVKRYRLFALSLLILAVASFILPYTHTFEGCLLVFLLFGVGIGAFYTTSSVACFDLMGRERYRVAYGWMIFLATFTHLIDSFGMAKLRDETGDFQASFLLVGCVCLIASACVFVEKHLLKLRKRNHPDW